jgi:hypothetical protein
MHTMIDDHLLGPRLDQSTIIQQIIIIDTELLKISLDTFAGYVTNSHREHQLWTIPFKFQHILWGYQKTTVNRNWDNLTNAYISDIWQFIHTPNPRFKRNQTGYTCK